MARVVECVPNFSEGQDKETIEAIAKAIGTTPGCTLLDVDPGSSTNRTVYTFVGAPEDVVKGALSGALAAASLIDMSEHKGEHPRLGAMDVCPFIPIQGVTMEECVQCARQLGEMLARTINVPVYLYGFAAEQDYRKTIPQIRSGEYEGLAEKLNQPEWAPDFGPTEFQPHWGATITGARNFLIAYNVNILGTKEQAHRIALNIREQGRGVDQPGRLKAVQAIGWYLEENNIAQVSVNITDINQTPVHVVYEECCKDAKEMNLTVLGSEVVGLIPKSCMMEAAEFYKNRENLFVLAEDQLIRLAINKLGLHSIKQFDPKEKIIEYMLQDDELSAPLSSLTVSNFVKCVSSRTPTPGGGSVSALIGALGCGLSSMAGLLTYGNKKFESLDSKMRGIIPPLFTKSSVLIPLIDSDSLAFNQFMSAGKLPSGSDEEKARKEEAKRAALRYAIQIPSTVAENVSEVWPVLRELTPIVNIQCISDLQVGVRCLQTAVWGAYYNVMTNVKDMEDCYFKKSAVESIEKHLKLMEEESSSILELAAQRK